jgi:hypothetical protein
LKGQIFGGTENFENGRFEFFSKNIFDRKIFQGYFQIQFLGE